MIQAHKVSAAILAFEQKLDTSEPVVRELQALKKVCQGKPGYGEWITVNGPGCFDLNGYLFVLLQVMR